MRFGVEDALVMEIERERDVEKIFFFVGGVVVAV